jgi:patatin-like phospholipase/acyl hydrolase
MSFKRRVLSIDGGGIRGIIPAIVLDYIEQKTKKNIAQMFDLIAGTSTGGILALGLTKPDGNSNQPQYSASDLVAMYREYGKEIFRERLPGKLDELIQAKYSQEGRNRVLKQYLGDTPIVRALTEVFIASYEIEKRIPVFFTSNPLAEGKAERLYHKICNGIDMTEAAMATSAAPTFFPPYKLEQNHLMGGTNYYALVDGGVFANNPTSLAMMEAMLSYRRSQGEELHRHEILVVSLGTGSLTRNYEYEQAKTWGKLKWIEPLINIIFDSQSEAVACQLNQLLIASGDRQQYYRFQDFLDRANDEMDDASEKNIEDLIDHANQLVEKNKNELDKLCQQLNPSSIPATV